MEQHHNYESETFGFINAFTEAENFSLAQEDAPKTETTQDVIPADYNSAVQDMHSTADTAQEPFGISNEFNEPISNLNADETEKESNLEVFHDCSQEQLSMNQQLENSSLDTKPACEESIQRDTDQNHPQNHKNDSKEGKLTLSGRKRRRIMLLNDEDDSENELKKELLDKSSDVEQQADEEKSTELGDLADNEAEAESETDIAVGTVNKNFLKAKYLLKSAVVIGPEKKKKKTRVLDSDDESDQLLNTSVDDIGLINESNSENLEEPEEIFTENIVILEDNIFDQPEENPAESNAVTTDPTETPENPTESQSQTENNEKIDEDDPKEIKVKVEPKENESGKSDQINIKEEKEEEDVEAVLDKIQPMDDDDDFFKFNDSSDEDGKNSVNNNEYFGSSDKTRNVPKKRGPKPGFKRQPVQPKERRKRGDRYDKDFVDDSESSSYSSSISSSSSDSESSTERSPRKKPQTVKNIQRSVSASVAPARPQIFQQKLQLQRQIAMKQDRFYDKSRNIPNDVYFGDVQVPLHVLHSRWNVDEETRRLKRLNAVNRPIQRVVTVPHASHKPAVQQTPRPQPQHHSVHSEDSNKLTRLKDYISQCGIRLNYPRLFSGVKSNDHKCIILRRILAQKGMEGEPTPAKCRKLKRELQAKRESAELDKSVILNCEGRTRRSRRGASAKDSEESLGTSTNEAETKTIQPEVLQTLSKIKSVIDSDSD